MPLELQVIRATEFIRMAPNGEFDLAASRAALAELGRACRKRGIDRALLDLRAFAPGPRPRFTEADLIALVNIFPEIGFNEQQRLAVLYRFDPHCRARLFARLGTARGWTVRAFNNFERSLSWLSAGADTPAPSPANVVPVRRLRSRTKSTRRKPRLS